MKAAHSVVQLRALVEAVRVFRNEPALARLGGLRGAPGYIGLCQAWDDARDWLEDVPQTFPHACGTELAASERDELQRLRALINTPHTADWMRATELEAAHQVERWSTNHDAGKQPEDWFWLLGYLSGKALASFRTGDREKGLHHIVSSSAALLNWHRNLTGKSTAMRPGIDAASLEREATGATLEQQP